MQGSSASAPTISAPLALSGPAGRIAVVPTRGAKITSLTDSDGTEWLAPCRALVGDPTVFVDAEMGGWDECAPTIDAGVLPDGRAVADHGDVWDRPWEVVVHSETEFTCRVTVSHLGFTLTRRIIPTPTGFRFDYRATLLDGGADLPFLWAAHPQFVAPDRIEVPGLSAVVVTHPTRSDEPQPWPTLPWPTLHWPTLHWPTQPWPTPTPGIATTTGATKYWAHTPPLPERVVLHRGSAHLTMSWGGEPLRGLAIWVDPGVFADTDVVAVEPATGLGSTARADAVTALVPRDEVASLTADEPLHWWLRVDFSAPSGPRGGHAHTD